MSKFYLAYKYIIFLIFTLISINFIFLKRNEKYLLNDFKNNVDSNQFEIIEEINSALLLLIQNKLNNSIWLSSKEQNFLFGIIRRFKPKKILEIGVSAGGSSAVILNAIKDLPNSKLYSIDKNKEWYLNHSKFTGWAAKNYFPELIENWSLYAGGNPSEFIEKIGNNIDLVFIDTAHYTPGEMINFLEVLPFLKEEAIVVIHDIYLIFVGNYKHKKYRNYSNNQLICYIRGKLILPSYDDKLFNINIGAVKLDKNQKKYLMQYFMALGNQWDYFPQERDITIFRDHFMKYYDKKFVEIYDDAIAKNRYRFS